MGQAKHSKQHATFKALTALDPDAVARLARDVGESIKNPVPGGAYVRFESASPGQLEFGIHGGAHTWGNKAVMTFLVDIGQGKGGQTSVDTRIDAFRTSRHSYMFIPVTPKMLEGYRTYKKFAEQFGAALAASDPTAQSSFIERPQR